MAERLMMDDPEMITVTSEDPLAMRLREAMKDAAMELLDDVEDKLPTEVRAMTLTVALVGLVWDSASIDRQIMTTTVKTLLGLVIDAGLAEEVGLVQKETMQ